MKIIRRELPAEVVYEDEDTIAFLDIRPDHPGHTLVVPKKQARNVFDVDSATFSKVMEVARTLAPKVREAVGADGLRVTINNEPAAGQVVFHLHVHLIPFSASAPAGMHERHTANPDSLQEVGAKIRALL